MSSRYIQHSRNTGARQSLSLPDLSTPARAAFATYLSVPYASLLLTETAALRWYRSSPEVLRGFCQHCGSSLFWHHQHEPDNLIAVAVAALDNPPVFGEIRHLCVDERAPWCPSVEPNSV